MPDDTDPTRIEPQPTDTGGEHEGETVLDTRLFAEAARAGQGALEQSGDFIGRYRLVEKIGEGGFGAVWKAEQSEPIRREVALKVIKAGMDSAEIIARFEAERQALALMDHPNIAGVLDAGTTQGGRPYFVMELVKGVPITEFADTRKLTIRERLELFIPICHAVQHAHQKAILHRDLKPSNILIAEVDGKPVPKVIDFGIAKALGTSPEDALRTDLHLTQAGSFIGTPRYMSPEQAGAKQDLDTRSDIYTLGVILYELLTGDTPLSEQTLRSAALDEMLRMIRESEPPRPSSRVATETEIVRRSATTRGTEPGKLTRTLRGDLDWITLRALEKDRERRYGSAAALAADIARHLHSEPVEAGPPSALYRFRKLVRRNRLAFAASAIIFLLLVAGIAVSTRQMFRAQRAEGLATLRFQQVAEQKKRADSEAEIAKAVSDFLQYDLLMQAGSREQLRLNATPNPNLTVREALGRASERIGISFSGKPLVEAGIREAIGRAYNDLGEPKKAETELRRALELRTSHLGADHGITLWTRRFLGVALQQQHRGSEAEREFRFVMEHFTSLHGPEHKDTLVVRMDIATALYLQGKNAEAEAEHRAVLAIKERVLGPMHEETLESRGNLAVTLAEQGKDAEAEQEFKAVLAAYARAHSPNHPNALGLRGRLALLLARQGKTGEAEREFRELLAAQRRVMGPGHRQSLATLGHLGELLYSQGRHSELEQILRDEVANFIRTFGADDVETLTVRNNLAAALSAQGKRVEEEKELRLLIAGQEHIFGREHLDTLSSRHNLAHSLLEQGKVSEAEEELRFLVPTRTRILGAEDPATLRSRLALAKALMAGQKFLEAEKEFRALLAIQERTLGLSHTDVFHTCYVLAECLYRQGRFDEALTFAKRTLADRQRNAGDEHAGTQAAQELVNVITAAGAAAPVPGAPALPGAMPEPQPGSASREGTRKEYPDVCESFEQPAQQPIAGANGGIGWAGPWSGAFATVDAASLVTADFPARGGSLLIPANEQEVTISRTLGRVENMADIATGGTWFFACLLQHGSDLPVPGGDVQINPFNASDIHGLVRIVASDMGGALNLTLNNEPNPIDVKDTSKPVLVVLRVTLGNPRKDMWDLSAELFVNPPLTGAEPPADSRKVRVDLPAAHLSQRTGLLIRKPARTDAVTRVDEVRYCRRFSDIAPRSPNPPEGKKEH